VTVVDEELLIAETVRRWAPGTAASSPRVVDRAVAVALRAFAGGASIAEACAEGRRFLACCARHPAFGAWPSKVVA
jgi:hypothetical protein